jgi:hypothetical protein
VRACSILRPRSRRLPVTQGVPLPGRARPVKVERPTSESQCHVNTTCLVRLGPRQEREGELTRATVLQTRWVTAAKQAERSRVAELVHAFSAAHPPARLTSSSLTTTTGRSGGLRTEEGR